MSGSNEDNMEGRNDINEIYVERQLREPGFVMKQEHVHAYYEIFYLKTGSCVYYLNGQRYQLGEGDMFLVNAGDTHGTVYEGENISERIVIHWNQEFLPKNFSGGGTPQLFYKREQSGKVVLEKKEGKKQIEALLENMVKENDFPNEYSSELLHLYLMTLLLLIDRDGIFLYESINKNMMLSRDIEEAAFYIAQNFSMPITLEEVAKTINLTPTYLSRKFKKEMDTTFKEYVTYIRIRRASQMLATTDDSITQIALNCGFNSSNYFKDCFRRIQGVSPRAFRQQKK